MTHKSAFSVWIFGFAQGIAEITHFFHKIHFFIGYDGFSIWERVLRLDSSRAPSTQRQFENTPGSITVCGISRFIAWLALWRISISFTSSSSSPEPSISLSVFSWRLLEDSSCCRSPNSIKSKSNTSVSSGQRILSFETFFCLSSVLMRSEVGHIWNFGQKSLKFEKTYFELLPRHAVPLTCASLHALRI